MRTDLTAGLIAALALGGCASDPAGENAGGGAASSSSSSSSPTSSSSGGGTGGSGGSGPGCKGPGYMDSTPGQVLNSVEAVINDVQGNPVSGLQIQLCSINLCFYGTTDANGHVLVRGPSNGMMQKPAFKYGDAFDYVRLGALVPRQPVVVYGTPFMVTRYPDENESKPIVPGQPLTSNDVTVTIPDGAMIDIDTLIFDTPARQGLRAVEVPLGSAMPALDPAIPLELVFALAPLDTHVCPAAAVSVPNKLGWAADSEVEFLLHGLEGSEEWAPYGGWVKVSDGKVSADGARIETAAGGGLPVLGVFGVHLK